MASPWHNHGLSIAAEPDPVTAGQSVFIYGQLKGRDNAYQRVILYHHLPYQQGFSPVGSTRTDSKGFYEFVRPDGIVMTNRQWFVLGPGYTHSRTVHEYVYANVSLTTVAQSVTTGQAVNFSGSVSPNHPDQRVILQEQTDNFGNGWQTIAATTTDANSNFTFAPTFKLAGDFTLRAYFQGDPRNLTSKSQDVNLAVQQAQNPAFTINGSAAVVTDGQPVTISGTLYTPTTTTGTTTTPTTTTTTTTSTTAVKTTAKTAAATSSTTPQSGVSVTLYGKVGSSNTFKALASTTTAADGTYSFAQVPQYTTDYKVLTGGASPESTADLFVGVQDVVTINASTMSPELGQTVTISGNVTPQHTGHTVVLQELDPNGDWIYVAMSKLDANSNYSFSYLAARLGNVQLRVQIGGGPESVGADSAPVQLTVSGLAPVASLPAAPLLRG